MGTRWTPPRPAEPNLSEDEQAGYTWTPAEEHKRTKEDFKAWREGDRRPFRGAAEEEEEEEAARPEDECQSY